MFVTIHPVEVLENKEIPHFVPMAIGTPFGMTLGFVIWEEESSGALCAPLLSSSLYPPKLNCHPSEARNLLLMRVIKIILNNKYIKSYRISL